MIAGTMRSYETAAARLDKRPTKDRKKLGWETYLVRHESGVIAVRYHETDVVSYTPAGNVILDTGGWKTVTTKRRMNDYAPVTVYQTKGVWYVHPLGDFDTEPVPYYDGMVLDAQGNVLDPSKAPDPAEELELRKRAKAYAAKYVEKLLAGEIPAPSGGDCWGCFMRKSDGQAALSGCMLSHLEEEYYVPSITVNAFKRFGVAPIVEQLVWSIWAGEELNGYVEGGFLKDRLTILIRRFVYHELGLSV